MAKKLLPLVSVGIAAYNEQFTIASVLKEILVQEHDTWKLKEILVFTDGCSDDTVKMAKSVKSSLITIVEDTNRKGKTYRLNQMFHKFTGDILVMFDADIQIKGTKVISHLIQPFAHDKSVMVTGGNSTPFKPQTFFERAVYSTFEVFYDSRLNFQGGNNVFGCTGSIMAVRKPFAKSLKLPHIVNEDAYIYLSCLQKGYRFTYVDNAVIHYRLPKNTKDYLKQVLRSEPKAVEADLATYFPATIVNELHRPLMPFIYSVAKAFLRNPIGVMYVCALNFVSRPFLSKIASHYDITSFTASSTKYAAEQLSTYKKTPAEHFNTVGLQLISVFNSLVGKYIFKTTPPLILCYHSVANDNWRFSTPVEDFKKQIEHIKRTKTIVSLKDILNNKKNSANSVAITFDDGYTDNLEIVAPLLQKLNIPAILFMIGDTHQANRSELDNTKPLLPINAVKKLKKQGWEIGFHTRTHADLSQLSDQELHAEIVVAKHELERKLGFSLDYFAYPRGAYTPRIVSFVKKAGFSAAFTVDGGAIQPASSTFMISRVPMERVISGNSFKALLTPIGLKFLSFYMGLLRFKAYELPKLRSAMSLNISAIIRPLRGME